MSYNRTIIVNPVPPEPEPSDLRLVPIDDLDPFELEVHRAITALDATEAALPSLPRYVSRPHDDKLRQIVQRASEGTSEFIVLVGGSSAGKTRACWEAIQHLPAGWTVWHPISPSPAQAVLDGLARVPPYTVVWLNELQHYLVSPEANVSELLAANVRELIRDRQRAPVLIMGTIWPEYLSGITNVPSPDEVDLHPQVRILLDDNKLPIPSRFSQEELVAVRTAASNDPRLRQAVAFSRFGEITQYLAAGPAMVERYQAAPSPAQAVINAVLDVRRLVDAQDSPRSFLEHAAPGYLSDSEWQSASGHWLDQALTFAGAMCRGASGLVVRRRQKPGQSTTDNPGFTLSDYLAQWGRTSRYFEVPPAEFWQAARDHFADTAVLLSLGSAAADRWRLRHAAMLFERAAEFGNLQALVLLGEMHARSGNFEQAETHYHRAAKLGNSTAQIELARLLDARGKTENAERWLLAAADQHDARALQILAQLAESAGDNARAEQWLREAVEAAGITRTRPLRQLARLRAEAGDQREAAELRARAKNGVQTVTRRPLADIQQRSGGPDKLEQNLRERISEAESAGRSASASDLALLSEVCEDKGNRDEAEALAERAALAGDPFAFEMLIVSRGRNGEEEEAVRLARRITDAGNANGLMMIVDAFSNDPHWQRICRLGLEPDGTTATDWF
ncbi:SEL1-like repeat protein [Amycolatopsis decaplanina]|uniref:Sel1 domain-containing protein repeat-containing protein n=1 Tax=Amycolatopsis decaplanina DSM 44594 TaxID=1284240 RepID=M2YGT1_9PSEU|nr:sel1 repeat family protein [Amycolatopsis decaplanina]EME60925.1 Sel1 domain-containing protein repeat-containing protein [Amycolatopsis decaplanina DSM 44594]